MKPIKSSRYRVRKLSNGGNGEPESDNTLTEGSVSLGDLASFVKEYGFDSLNEAKRRLRDNIYPVGYTAGMGNVMPQERILSAILQDSKEYRRRRMDQMIDKGVNLNVSSDVQGLNPESLKERTDLFSMALGQGQQYDTIEESEYKPSKSVEGDDSTTYYRSKVTEREIQKLIDANEPIQDLTESGYHNMPNNVLGNYVIDYGEDDRGKYISYYDKWDLNPFSRGAGQVGGDSAFRVTKASEDFVSNALGVSSPEIYGRIYFDANKYDHTPKSQNKTPEIVKKFFPNFRYDESVKGNMRPATPIEIEYGI
jgi:hypothetical protein